MWKRLNNPKGARQPGVTSPVETSFDEKSYSGTSGKGVHSQPQGRGNAPPRPPRDDLPSLPYDPVPPPPPEHRDSRFRPASSIYSQPSPNPIVTRFPRNSYQTTTTTYTEEEEVSPPSSPDSVINNSQSQANEEVSPIDQMPNIPKVGFGRPPSRPGSSSKPPSSNIPTLRREKRRNLAANVVARKEVGGPATKAPIVDPRWDPYSGEITTSEKGKPQTAKPGQFAPPGLRPVHKETSITMGNESNVTAGPKTHSSFGDRVRRLKSSHNPPVERPEWKGATGRAAIVSPVADNFDVAPLNIPRKSSKRVTSPQLSSQSGSTTPVSVIRIGDGETGPASADSAQMSQYIDPTIRTITSNSGGSSPQVESPISIIPNPVVINQPAANRSIVRNPVPTEVRHQKEDSTGTIERNFHEAFKDINFFSPDSSEPYVQPPSRFSVTTYAPSESQSPRPSTETFDRPPMPTPPQTFTPQQQPSPILNRKHPKVAESPKASVPRKAVAQAPGSPVFISMSSSIASKRASNVAKTLPMSPAEAQSHDLVTSLQAQLDDLAHRRMNIERSIRQMTELMPKDSVILTEEVRRKREDEKKKVEALRIEEADVKREEHDIGLRLHRAWKRRDKEAVYEPTGLWVRRVTG